MVCADEQPFLSDLLTLVVTDPVACSKWETVGMALGLADDDDGSYLEELAEEDHDPVKCFIKVLKKWLRDSKTKPHVKAATWGCLLTILKLLEIRDAVLKVEEHKGEWVCLLARDY